VLRNVVIAIPLYGLATVHAAWLMQPYWEAQGISLAMFGLLWFSQSIVIAVAARFGFVIERRYGAIRSLVLMGLLPIVGHFGMAWDSHRFAAVCLQRTEPSHSGECNEPTHTE